MIFTMIRKSNLIGFIFICFFFWLHILNGKYYTVVLLWKQKYVKHTDSFDVFRFYFSIGSSVDCQCSVLFRGFAFDTVFIYICIKYICIYLFVFIYIYLAVRAQAVCTKRLNVERWHEMPLTFNNTVACTEY